MANMNPRGDLASTGFCLAKPGIEYILYLSGDATFSVSGLQAGRSYYCQSYDPEQGEVTAAVKKKVSNTTEKPRPRTKSSLASLKLDTDDG